LAVAGTHGKTTTTSLLAGICAAAGLDPTVVVGGRLRSLGSNARLGQGEYIVAEADESDGSFLKLSPTIAVVTNIDSEHLDHYGSYEKLVDAFAHFVNQVPFYGGAVLCFDSAAVRALLPRIEKPLLTYGFGAQAELRAHSLRLGPSGVRFAVDLRRDPLGTVELPLMGRHNVLNALGALGAALELDIPFETAAAALADFGGVARRLEQVGTVDDIVVFDDYGHHPTEVAATLSALREHHQRPLRVLFQPHRYTRTRDLFEAFLSAFDDADNVAMLDIYAAGEEPIPGVDTASLVAALRARGHRRVEQVPDLEAALRWLLDTARPGEAVITLGAGDVSKVAPRFLHAMETAES
jgi:UDP-N-acetylmuramate--alanine ligase